MPLEIRAPAGAAARGVLPRPARGCKPYRRAARAAGNRRTDMINAGLDRRAVQEGVGMKGHFGFRAVATVLVCLFVGASAFAQQPPPRPPAATPGRPPAAQVPAPAANPAVREQAFQDWRVRCVRFQANQPEQCAGFIEFLTQETNQRILNFAVIVAPGQPVPVATLTLPLGLFLPPGAQIAIDSQNPLTAPLQTCVPEGCQVSLNLDQAILPRLQSGKQMNISFVEYGERKTITLNVSLNGFSQMLAALRR
jgi:invasion protein IalB